MVCEKCHTGHSSSANRQHLARIACQTCHIPTFAKDALDSQASEATETHRSWLSNQSVAAPFHPTSTKANDLVPRYRFWSGFSSNYLLGDVAAVDSITGNYPTSRPEGSVADGLSKLYPFKYKTAEQPLALLSGELIALDTSLFFATADAYAATRQGLANMGQGANDPYEWVMTDTFQALNHEVSPAGEALQCADCHGSTTRMDLKGELGYQLKGSTATVCTQCHGREEVKPFYEVHSKHVEDKGYDCSWCHSFSRPERGLRMP